MLFVALWLASLLAPGSWLLALGSWLLVVAHLLHPNTPLSTFYWCTAPIRTHVSERAGVAARSELNPVSVRSVPALQALGRTRGGGGEYSPGSHLVQSQPSPWKNLTRPSRSPTIRSDMPSLSRSADAMFKPAPSEGRLCDFLTKRAGVG